MAILEMESSSSESKYSRETLMEAVKSIINGHLTVSEAFEKYHGCIPRRTLQHHMKYDIFIYKCINYPNECVWLNIRNNIECFGPSIRKTIHTFPCL